MAYSIRQSEFKSIAEGVVKELPDEFKRRMENVAIVIEDRPSLEDAREAGVARDELMGLFCGLSYGERNSFFEAPSPLPERIILYKKNIEEVCSTREELVDEVRLTVLHEIGHYFGLTEEDLEEYEPK